MLKKSVVTSVVPCVLLGRGHEGLVLGLVGLDTGEKVVPEALETAKEEITLGNATQRGRQYD